MSASDTFPVKAQPSSNAAVSTRIQWSWRIHERVTDGCALFDPGLNTQMGQAPFALFDPKLLAQSPKARPVLQLGQTLIHGRTNLIFAINN